MIRRGCARALAAPFLALVLVTGCSHAGAAQPVKKLVAVDAASPPLELKDTKGRLHRLSDYRGKVVLVNFWATWCEPCRDEMPSMQALYRRAGPQAGGGLAILAVNHAENLSRIEQFLRHHPLDFPVLIDPFSSVWSAWKPGLLPSSYLIGRDGRVRYRALGEIDWAGKEAEAILRRLLADKD
ncbi:MAG: TlpA family protein disulfide reductase [Betaproteobacteria bacterium]|nr:MAG: TlpA family protein disulfide reductase [Betaproteobacteria bacterium]